MNNNDFNRQQELPDREKLLRRVFATTVEQGEWRPDQFHTFCRWSKGRSGAELLADIGIGG